MKTRDEVITEHGRISACWASGRNFENAALHDARIEALRNEADLTPFEQEGNDLGMMLDVGAYPT